MANRFIKPQKANDVYHPVDHYIPLPFDEIANTLKQRQSNYDTNKEYQQSHEDAFNQFQTRAADAAAKNKLVNDYQNEIHGIVKDKYHGDYGAAGEELSDVTRKYARNPFWRAAQAEHQHAAEHQKFIDEANKNGKGVLHFNNRAEYNATPIMNEDGTINDISHLRPDSRVQMDWTKALNDATKLHANTFAGAARKGNVAGYLEQIKSGGISDKQVKNSLADARVRIIHTPEGRQMLEYYTKRLGNTDDALKQLDSDILAHGMQQVHSNVDRSYIGDKEQEHAWDLDKIDHTAAAKAAAKKAENVAGRAQLIPNQSDHGITVQDNAAIWGTNKHTIPFHGQSDRVYNQFSNSYTPTGKMFVYGDDENRAKSGKPSEEKLEDATFVKTVVGYKLAGGPNAGAPLVKGVAGSAGATADDNHIEKDKYGNMYVTNEDHQQIPVQYQAYKLHTTKDGKTALEEANRLESQRDLGGMNMSGERWIQKGGDSSKGERTAGLNMSNQDFKKYLGINDAQLNPQSPYFNKQAYDLMENMARIERDGIHSKEDEQFVDDLEHALDQGYDQQAVQPGILNWKPELTPKSLLGGASEKDTENEE